MASTGQIKTIYLDREKEIPLFPRSKVKAISDDSGKSLEVILEELKQLIEGDETNQNMLKTGGKFIGNVTMATGTDIIYEDGSALKTLLSDLMPKTGGKFTGAVEYTTLTGGDIVSSGKVYGAVWNDYAEYRESTEKIEPGYIVCENGDDTVSLSSERLQPAPLAVSDTFGFAIGETDKCKCPIAVAGRVLVFPYEDRNSYKPGDAVCAAPGGKVSKMSREEIREYPERILGTVSAIPDYKFWGDGNIEVQNRIWIKI